MGKAVIQINIASNQHHSGKSTIALIIRQALDEAGFTDIELTSTHVENYDHISEVMPKDKTVFGNKVIINDIGNPVDIDVDKPHILNLMSLMGV